MMENIPGPSSMVKRRSPMSIGEKKLVTQVFKCLARDRPGRSKDELVEICAEYTGTSKYAVYRVLREEKKYGEVQKPKLSDRGKRKDESRCSMLKHRVANPRHEDETTIQSYNHLRLCSLHFKDEWFDGMLKDKLKPSFDDESTSRDSDSEASTSQSEYIPAKDEQTQTLLSQLIDRKIEEKPFPP